MGQKSNLITLREYNPNISLTSANTQVFKQFLNFSVQFKRLLNIKGIWIVNQTINTTNSICNFNLIIYYRSNKISFYKKKKFIKISKNFLLFNKKFSGLNLMLTKYFSFFKSKQFLFSIINVNKKMDKKILRFFTKKINPFLKVFFQRRFNLFVDFLKITTLLFTKKINTATFLLLIVNTFKNLSKRSHMRFLAFLTFIFKLLIFNTVKELKISSSIKGVKFSISGRLSGKARSSYHYIQEGQMPIQTLSKNIEFSKMHAYNFLGAFGLRIWLYRN